MRAPIIRLTIGDYLYRVAGMLENVNVSIDDNYPWDININEDGTPANRKQLPQVINIQCSFKPIQDMLPRKITQANPNVPFITEQNGNYLDNLIFQRVVENIPTPEETQREIANASAQGTEINLAARNTTNSSFSSFTNF
jgi:hypothetical protein